MGQKSGKETLELDETEVNRLSEKTGLSNKQILLIHDSFLSDCPDGKLSRKKFNDFYHQFYPHGKPLRFSNFVFNTFINEDRDFLDFESFVEAIQSTIHGDASQRMERAFKMYDLNADGFIDKREMIQILESIYELIGEDVKVLRKTKDIDNAVDFIFEKFDKNKDDKLSKEEFIAGCKEDKNLEHLLNLNPTTLKEKHMLQQQNLALTRQILRQISNGP